MTLAIGNRVFAPSVAATAITLLLLIVLLGLGRWQLARMHEKEALFARFEAAGASIRDLALLPVDEAPLFQRVGTIGAYDTAHQFLLDNLTHEGRVGYQVLTPLVIDAGRTVMVNRGWLPAPPTREELPVIDVPTHERSVTGRLNDLPSAGIALDAPPVPSDTPWPRVVSYPTMAQLEVTLGRPLHPRVLQLDPDQPDGFVREWKPSTFPPERHFGYAVTWFTLAATLLVLYCFAGLRRR
jgi:surfeit locus 1 family protein